MIRLALICRDEAARLPAIAERLDGFLHDAYVLVDDRTTDDTRQVALDTFSGLPGGAHAEDFTFGDFGQARNLLLDRAREGLDADDYLMLLDPDSLPTGELPSDEELTADAYSCAWWWHGETWPRVILLRASADAHWIGRVHETLAVNGTTEHVETVHVEAVVTATPDRLEWIAGVLREDAAVNPRSAFYLAQTLADLGRRDEALCWYLRRAAMSHGWDEETFLATYQAGCIIEALDWQIATTLWQRAAAMRPGRAEPWWQLARAANQRGDHSEALALASVGLRTGRSTDTLRVNRWIENEGLSGEFNAATTGLLGIPTPTLEHADG